MELEQLTVGKRVPHILLSVKISKMTTATSLTIKT
jgi:hypothetical protein